MLWKMQCFALQSMGHTNHKFPVYATWNECSSATEINCINTARGGGGGHVKKAWGEANVTMFYTRGFAGILWDTF